MLSYTYKLTAKTDAVSNTLSLERIGLSRKGKAPAPFFICAQHFNQRGPPQLIAEARNSLIYRNAEKAVVY
jgi:hypothetical protein